MGKTRTKDIGISKKEYEVGVVLERLFALAKANKCATCLLWHPTHVNLTRAELLCAACSARTKNKAKIGADLISKEDLERLERVYNGGKNASKSKKYGRQESDNWTSSFKHKKSHRHHHHSSRSRRKSVSSRYSSASVSESSISSASGFSSSPSRHSYSSYEYARKSPYSARDVSIPKSRRFDDGDYGDGYYRSHHQHHYPQEPHLRNGKSASRHQYDSKLKHSYSAHAMEPSSKSRSGRHHSRHHHHHHHDDDEREREHHHRDRHDYDHHGHPQHHSERDRDHRGHGHQNRHSHNSARDGSAPAIAGRRTDARDIPGMVGIMASRQKASAARDAMHSYSHDTARQVAPNHANGDYWPMVPPRKGQHGSASIPAKINGKTPTTYAELPSFVPAATQQQLQAPGYHPTNPFSGPALAAPKAIADAAKYKNPAFYLGHMRNALLNNGIGPIMRPPTARLQQDELARYAHLNSR